MQIRSEVVYFDIEYFQETLLGKVVIADSC